MLGIGNSLITGGGPVPFKPDNISNLIVWLKWNENITADKDSGGSAISHSTSAGNMANGDQINAWNGFGNTTINAVQTFDSDKPRWSTATGELGGVRSSNDNKHMDLTTELDFHANIYQGAFAEEFSIIIRFRVNDFDAERVFLGDDANEYFSLVDENTIRVKTGSTNEEVDASIGTDDMQVDKDITIMIIRHQNPALQSVSYITTYVRGEDYHTTDLSGRVFGTLVSDSSEILINYIMAKNDGQDEFDGIFKDVLVYEGVALNSGQRKSLFDYLEAQET